MSTLASITSFVNPSDKPAVIIPGDSPIKISYEQLVHHISALQLQLATLGIGANQAVSISLPNGLEFIITFLATCWQRAIAAPLNPGYKQGEVDFYVKDVKSSLIIVPEGAYDKKTDAVQAAQNLKVAIAECVYTQNEVQLNIKEWGILNDNNDARMEKPQDDDVALILHTSGTTGRPKAVPLTHKNLTTSMSMLPFFLHIPASSSDRNVVIMPLFHVHGLVAAFLSQLAAGGCAIVPRSLTGSFWRDYQAHEATWYTGTPTMHQILIKYPVPSPLPSIRFIRSCSSPMSSKVYHDVEEKFSAPVLEAYAMTEASHQMTSSPLPPKGRKPGSVGKAASIDLVIMDDKGKKLNVGEVGEVCIKGENVTKGYLNNEDANKSSYTADGFFRTGDQGRLDKDGFLTLTGRLKELINKGGEKISPIEIDELVSQHPLVTEAVSFAIDDPMYGQEVGLAVVKKEGTELEVKDLKKWIKERISDYKVPKKIWFVEVMPKTATGKVQRRLVSETVEKQ